MQSFRKPNPSKASCSKTSGAWDRAIFRGQRVRGMSRVIGVGMRNYVVPARSGGQRGFGAGEGEIRNRIRDVVRSLEGLISRVDG